MKHLVETNFGYSLPPTADFFGFPNPTDLLTPIAMELDSPRILSAPQIDLDTGAA